MSDQLYRIMAYRDVGRLSYIDYLPDDEVLVPVGPDNRAAGNAIMHEIERDPFWITRREVIGKLAVDAALKGGSDAEPT